MLAPLIAFIRYVPLDGISQKVLTDSLRSMEEDGIITRFVDNQMK